MHKIEQIAVKINIAFSVDIDSKIEDVVRKYP